MIFGNIHNLEAYRFLEKGVLECFSYASANDLKAFETGRHNIDGDRLFVNIAGYRTQEPIARFWEAHHVYLDVHVMLQGTEQVDLNFIQNMKELGYTQEEDFLSLQGGKNSSVILQEGDFLICYPQDAHRTGVQVDGPQAIRKAIFKVLLSGL